MNRNAALPTLTPDTQTRWLAQGQPALTWFSPQESTAARLDAELYLFEPISLAELAEVALLDRIDTKYVLRLPEVMEALPALRADYRVLEFEQRRHTPYRTLYFDTPGFDLYRWHQAGRRVRYKVRSREYLSSGVSFLEVKRKSGPSRTHKERLATSALVTSLTPEARAFLQGRLPLPPHALEPKLWVDYTRVTLASRRDRERLTLDFDLQFWTEASSVALPGLVTAEVKHVGRPRAPVFIQLMRQRQIRRAGFSKYCIGASLIYPDLKHNRFNRALRQAERLTNTGDWL